MKNTLMFLCVCLFIAGLDAFAMKHLLPYVLITWKSVGACVLLLTLNGVYMGIGYTLLWKHITFRDSAI